MGGSLCHSVSLGYGVLPGYGVSLRFVASGNLLGNIPSKVSAIKKNEGKL